jgi:hypothetical protein
VNAQRPFILTMALLGATGTVFFAVWAHEDRMFNTGIKQVRDDIKAKSHSSPKP